MGPRLDALFKDGTERPLAGPSFVLKKSPTSIRIEPRRVKHSNSNMDATYEPPKPAGVNERRLNSAEVVSGPMNSSERGEDEGSGEGSKVRYVK